MNRQFSASSIQHVSGRLGTHDLVEMLAGRLPSLLQKKNVIEPNSGTKTEYPRVSVAIFDNPWMSKGDSRSWLLCWKHVGIIFLTIRRLLHFSCRHSAKKISYSESDWLQTARSNICTYPFCCTALTVKTVPVWSYHWAFGSDPIPRDDFVRHSIIGMFS